MNEEHDIIRFGGQGVNWVHPIALGLLIIAILLILFKPKRFGMVTILVLSFLMPLGQQFVIGGLNFPLLRILILFGLIRAGVDVLSTIGGSNTRQRKKVLVLDKVFLFWCASSVITFTLLWWSWGAMINRLGFLLSIGGSYILLRYFIRDMEDVERSIRVLVVVCAVIAVLMLYEQVTGRNLYGILGGGLEFVAEREGRLRSQGPFGHPILAGTFGATVMPLFIGLRWQGRCSLPISLIGVLSATIITITSASATPLMAYIAGVGALCLWPLRRHMRFVLWGIVLSLMGLHLVMKAPVWSLIGRLDVVGGSSGWHRYYLVDQFIRNFGEWWLVGTRSTSKWGYSMLDTANQYIDIGVTGGLITLVLFVAIITCCFRALGTSRMLVEGYNSAEKCFWFLGAAVFSHVVGFFGICYFDQVFIAWNTLLAMIAAATSAVTADRVNSSETPTGKT